MKNIFTLSVLMLCMACTDQSSNQASPEQSTQTPTSAPITTMKYGVNLDEFPDKKGDDYALEFEWQENLAETYGRTFYKANNICGNKVSYILDKATDTSTEEGSLTIDEFNYAYQMCVRESLANQPIATLPEIKQHKLIINHGENAKVIDVAQQTGVYSKQHDEYYDGGAADEDKVLSCIENNAHIEESQWRHSATLACVHKSQ